MRESSFVGRVGGLAIALGVGAAIAGVGAGTAWADTGDDATRTDSTASVSPTRPDPGRSRSAPREYSPSPTNDRPQSVRRAASPAAASRVPVVQVAPRDATQDLAPAVAVTPLAVTPMAVPVISVTAQLTRVADVPRAMAATPAITRGIQSLAVVLAGSGPLQPAGPLESPLSWAVAAAARRTPSVTASATAAATGNPFATFFFNQTPTLNPSRIGQDSASVVTGDLNVEDADSEVKTYTVTKGPANGSVTVDSDGRYTYTPDAYYGRVGTTDTFTVTVSDAQSGFHIHGFGGLLNLLTLGIVGGSGHESTSTVTVVVDPRNTAPVATVAVGGTEPTAGRVAGKVIADDADGDPLSYAVSTAPAKGGVTIGADGSFTYTPTPAARHAAAKLSASAADKTDTFVITVFDPYGGRTAVTADVDIAPSNAAPTASVVTDDPNPLTGTVAGRLDATDADGDPLTYSGSTTTAKGSVTVSADGTFTYTPTAGARHSAALLGGPLADKSDTLVLTVADDSGGSAPVAVTVQISPTNIAPVVGGVTAGTPNAVSGVVAGSIAASDGDGDVLSYAGQAPKGTVTFSPNGGFNYVPTADARHTAALVNASVADKSDTLTITVSDGHGGQATATVKVEIAPLNEAPVADFTAGTPNPTSGVVIGRVIASDPEGDPLTYSGSTTTAKGSVTVSADGTFTYTPTAAARHAAARLTASVADKTDKFTITVTDNGGASTAVVVTVTVSPTNIAPVVAGSSVGSPDATTGLVLGSISATDGDGDPLTYSATPAKGSVTFTGGGGFSYTPTATARQAAANGGATSEAFTVTVADGYGGTATVAVTVGIAPAVGAPAVSFSFTYGSGSQYWTTEARAALESAAASLASYFIVNAPRTITVNVTGNNTPNSNNLAYASVDFTSYAAGYYGTIVQQKIIAGIDSNGQAADATISYNWAQPWALGNTVPNNQYDFKAVAIHELLHAVGFLTGADNSPSNVNWTTFDSFLRTSNGTEVIDPNTYAVINGYQGNFTGAGGGLYFTGPNAGTVKLYTPSTWEAGSSVSHVNQLSGYVMNPFLSYGLGARVLTPTEVGILRDIGFTVNDSPGVAAFIVVWVGVVRRRRSR